MYPQTVILPAGDSALTVQFPQVIEETINSQVHALAQALRRLSLTGVVETVPSFCSLLVCYDPLKISFRQLSEALSQLMDTPQGQAEKPKRIVEIPVCYGGAYGEDLADVAALAGLSQQQVIALHCEPDYLIYMLGFLPGFAYLGGLNKRIAVPRLENPRLKIEPGAVGIGGSQTGIYPLASPGGWRIIGRTPLKPYVADREPAILYEAGDYLRFVPISEAEFQKVAEQEAAAWASK